MNQGEKERFRNYFNRFLDPKVSFRQKWVSFWRYIGMGFGLVIEKLRGVDYAMIHQKEMGNAECGNYTMSPKKVLKRIFNDVEGTDLRGFIDIGCGKGYAVKLAYNNGFRPCGGIEYDKDLYDICISNLKIDKVPVDDVCIGRAEEYGCYEKYDIFYFNNPFSGNVMIKTLEKIYIAKRNSKCRCYWLNPNNQAKKEAFINVGFKYVKTINDASEEYFQMDVYEN